jgi:hypothetical protein
LAKHCAADRVSSQTPNSGPINAARLPAAPRPKTGFLDGKMTTRPLDFQDDWSY